MSDDLDRVLLREMIDAAERVADYIDAQGGETEFMRQRILYDAICLNLLRFGECARTLSEAAKSYLPSVPWPDIINLRHRVAHSYEQLKPSVLWRIASIDMPDLANRIRAYEGGL